MATFTLVGKLFNKQQQKIVFQSDGEIVTRTISIDGREINTHKLSLKEAREYWKRAVANGYVVVK
jgi:hypothetical protein